MKVNNTSIWIIIVSVCLFAVLGCVTLSTGNNTKDKNIFSNTVPAKHTDLSEEQILLEKLQEFRQESRKPRMSHGPMKEGLAAFMICERKQFKIGEPVPVMLGIVYGGAKKDMTVQPPFPASLPHYLSWFSITGPNGKDVPYTGPSVHFVPPKPEWAIRLMARRFCGTVKSDVGGNYELYTPGSYTIKWHYNIPPTSEGSWWQGHLVSNEIQIEIVP